jgi:hypothetical protein
MHEVPVQPQRDPAAGQLGADFDLESAVRQDGQIDLRVMFRKAFPSPAENTDSGALMCGRVTISWVALPGTALPEADWPQRLVNRVRRQWTSAHVG